MLIKKLWPRILCNDKSFMISLCSSDNLLLCTSSTDPTVQFFLHTLCTYYTTGRIKYLITILPFFKQNVGFRELDYGSYM